MPANIKEFNVEIHSILNQKVYSEYVTRIMSKIHTISTEHLESGVYYVVVKSKQGIKSKRIVIEK